MPRRGLPTSMSMRHDEHYVDALAASAGAPIGRLIPIEQIDPNPQQPRQVMGDLSELIASIGEKGILEPLVVRPRGERFQIVAGRSPPVTLAIGAGTASAAAHSGEPSEIATRSVATMAPPAVVTWQMATPVSGVLVASGAGPLPDHELHFQERVSVR